MQDPENLKFIGTVNKSFWGGGWEGRVVSGMLSRCSYFFPPSLCMNYCISIFDRGFLVRTGPGVDCAVGGVCVLSDVAVMFAILSGVIAGVCM